MKDAEFIFRQDIKEKKSIGHGALHKKNGSKSKKCTLPSDYLTRKEKAALNGEVITWDMKKFYSWEEFKSMPDDIQLQYVNSLINRYDVGLSTISEEVFGLTNGALSTHLKRHKLYEYVNTSHKSTSHKNRVRLHDAIEEAKSPSLTFEHSDTEPIAKVDSIEETTEGVKATAHVLNNEEFMSIFNQFRPMSDASTTSVSDFLVRMDRFDDEIWNYIKLIFGEQSNLQITISVNTKDS